MEHDCRYTPTIQSGAVVRFGLGHHEGKEWEIFGRAEVDRWSAEINASRDGVSLQGRWPVYVDRGALNHIKQVLEWAWEAHRAIAAEWDTSEQHAAAKRFVAVHNMSLLEVRAEAAKIASEN